MWRAIGTFTTGWEQYFRPGLHKAEEYRMELHDEEEGDGRKKDDR